MAILPAVAVLFAAVTLNGCGPNAPDEEGDAAGEQAGADGGGSDAGSSAAAFAEPVSPFGTFQFITPAQRGYSNLGALTIVENDGEPKVESFTPTQELARFKPGATLREATPDAVSLQIDSGPDGPLFLVFSGRPAPGVIIGTYVNKNGSAVMPAVLAPLPDGAQKPGPSTLSDPQAEQLVQTVQQTNPDAGGLEALSDEAPYSLAFFQIYPAVITARVRSNAPVEEVAEFADAYARFASRWGVAAEAEARRGTGYIFIAASKYRELADEQFAEALASLPEGMPEGAADLWKENFAKLGEQADLREEQRALGQRLNDAMRLAATDKQAGLKALREIRSDEPDNPATLYMLA
ncbi:MAG: hypothetical protein AAF907_11495, partial [Planctomycetota bacterium]